MQSSEDRPTGLSQMSILRNLGSAENHAGAGRQRSGMDVPRIDAARRRNKQWILFGAGPILLVGVITFGLARLKPAAVVVESASVWIDTVKRGPLLRQVRGMGTL